MECFAGQICQADFIGTCCAEESPGVEVTWDSDVTWDSNVFWS